VNSPPENCSLPPYVPTCTVGMRLLFAAATLRGSRAPLAFKEKKENEEKPGNRESCEKSRDQVQRVMDC
jgi:hypothetical protein